MFAFFFSIKSENILANKVKLFKKQLIEKKITKSDLQYKPGRGNGWSYQKQKINVHQLDALIVFFIWKEKR